MCSYESDQVACRVITGGVRGIPGVKEVVELQECQTLNSKSSLKPVGFPELNNWRSRSGLMLYQIRELEPAQGRVWFKRVGGGALLCVICSVDGAIIGTYPISPMKI